jgi:hypothetical protein
MSDMIKAEVPGDSVQVHVFKCVAAISNHAE